MHRLAVSVQNFKLFFEKRPIFPGAKTHHACIRLSQPAIKIKLNVQKMIKELVARAWGGNAPARARFITATPDRRASSPGSRPRPAPSRADRLVEIALLGGLRALRGADIAAEQLPADHGAVAGLEVRPELSNGGIAGARPFTMWHSSVACLSPRTMMAPVTARRSRPCACRPRTPRRSAWRCPGPTRTSGRTRPVSPAIRRSPAHHRHGLFDIPHDSPSFRSAQDPAATPMPGPDSFHKRHAVPSRRQCRRAGYRAFPWKPQRVYASRERLTVRDECGSSLTRWGDPEWH